MVAQDRIAGPFYLLYILIEGYGQGWSAYAGEVHNLHTELTPNTKRRHRREARLGALYG